MCSPRSPLCHLRGTFLSLKWYLSKTWADPLSTIRWNNLQNRAIGQLFLKYRQNRLLQQTVAVTFNHQINILQAKSAYQRQQDIAYSINWETQINEAVAPPLEQISIRSAWFGIPSLSAWKCEGNICIYRRHQKHRKLYEKIFYSVAKYHARHLFQAHSTLIVVACTADLSTSLIEAEDLRKIKFQQLCDLHSYFM
ncbi:hypothetical protein FGO68_gene6169 [Halteria grandinella]|uniref:Uncharacterized protein n=1 Tax=Halteria grandinella TaxID=5974 RepID=A0A8J8NK82_HALGN|nr:hypothetical protein FGO68_gene6169 [Halteria grandinella]